MKPTCLVLLLTLALSSSPCWAQRQVSSVVQFDNIGEVIDRWAPENQVYVRGNIGVGTRQLEELASWLRTNGPHWTIVLMESAGDQSFAAQDGRTFRGLDAVEAALGLGLNNRTSFGTLVHPETQESDGAVFVLFLRERKFSYYASDAQDARNLGEAHWVGQLDQPAFRAMRNGGRILDAVKDTVKTINNQLSNAIAAEKHAQLRLEEQHKRELVQVQSKLADLKLSISQIEAQGLAFAKEYPQATGEMAKPPIAQWTQKVTELEQQLTTETTSSVEQQISRLNSELDRYENAYAAHAGFRQQSESTIAQAAYFSTSPSPDVKQHGQALRAEFDTAQTQLQSGEIEFINSLAKTEESLHQAQAAADAFKQQQALDQQRRRLIRTTVITMLWIIAAIVAAILWWANRRRAATMRKAIEQWDQRHQSVTQETDQLDQLFQRNEDILGSRAQIEQRGYVGATRQLALQAIDYVDDLFIMSKEVKRVLQEARNLIHPSDPWHHLVNLFSSSRYQEAIDHITGSPLKFQRTTGIPLIIRDMNLGTVTKGQSEGIPDEVQLTFEEIFAAFQKRGVEAQQSLNTFEYCLSHVQELLTQTQQQLDTAAAQEKELDAQSAADGIFDVPAYFTELIPAIQTQIKQADDLAAFNAVQAVQGPLTTAQRQLTEAMELGRSLLQARQQLFPKLQADAQTLKQSGYTSSWIGNALQQITSQANQLYHAATEQSIAEGSQAVTVAIAELEKRSQRIVQLAEQIHQTLLPKQSALADEIAETRRDLASTLKLPEQSVLHELDMDPDDSLARARSSLDTARAMLLDGRVSAIEEALTTFTTACEQGHQILTASKEAVKNYKTRIERASQQLREGRGRVPSLRSGIEAAQRAYAASALLVAPQAELVSGPIVTAQVVTDSSTANDSSPASSTNLSTANPSRRNTVRPMDWYLAQAVQGHSEVERLIQSATDRHTSGQVLFAATELDQAEAFLQTTQDQLSQIADHLQLLQQQTEANVAQQQRNETQLETLQLAQRSPLVTRATLLAIDQVAGIVNSNRQLVLASAAAPNPFETAQALLKTQHQMEQLQAQVVGDQQAHAEARRAVQGARQHLQQANQLVHQTQSDGIPDSAQIIQTNSRISQLARDLDELESELQASHGDWRIVDQQAAQLQANLASSSQALSSELSAAGQALAAFQQASQTVLQAGQWAGPWGVRVSGSPGVSELERARRSLQSGNYDVVLQISQIAMLAAQTALQQAEREVARRRMEEEREREAQRRAREAATRRQSSPSFGGGSVFSSGSSGSSSSSSSSSSSGGASGSGFSRSGW